MKGLSLKFDSLSDVLDTALQAMWVIMHCTLRLKNYTKYQPVEIEMELKRQRRADNIAEKD